MLFLNRLVWFPWLTGNSEEDQNMKTIKETVGTEKASRLMLHSQSLGLNRVSNHSHLLLSSNNQSVQSIMYHLTEQNVKGIFQHLGLCNGFWEFLGKLV